MGANWFVALPIPLELDLSAFAPPRCVRVFGRHDLHITVAFLGRVTPERATAAFEAARSFSLQPLTVSLGRIKALGPVRRPSALSALLESGRSEVERCIGEVRDRVCDAAEVPHDPRPPLAHITLARPARSASTRERAEAIRWAESLELPALTARLGELALYTWSADRSQALFRIERRFDLGAPQHQEPT